MLNTDEVSSNRSKMHIKRFNDKISISDLQKMQSIKQIPLLSTSSSVQKVEFDSETNSIIDKLEILEMEGKTAPSLKPNTPDTDRTDIFLP